MTNFSDIFPAAAVLEALGDDVIYKRGSKLFNIKANIEFNVEQTGQGDSHIPERRTEVEFLKSAITLQPMRGDLIKTATTTFTVDSVVTDDGLYIKVKVTKQ
jgi:hypothetical protein